ncbi:MAG: methyltransferase domain-containing protein [Alphaproteobacteria bacterium]|nr:methyltransferase domain-containing protein [Alphaproteobacteria bacterium]
MTQGAPSDQGLFDPRLQRRRRARAAARDDAAEFLFVEAAERLADRLLDVARTFPLALEIGCRKGALAARLPEAAGVGRLVGCDLSPEMAAVAQARTGQARTGQARTGQARTGQARTGAAVFAADPAWLPVREESFDLVISSLALHWVEDLPGALIQINRALKPDGLFLAAALGGDTLAELRAVMVEAEDRVRGGAAPRVAPTLALQDAGALMQRAGFALPVVDFDRLTVTYETFFHLAAELRAMGETAAMAQGPRGVPPRALFTEAARLYAERHAGPDGRIQATFDIVYLHGWAPHESQQKPMRPGSARHRLADALQTVERPAGDLAPAAVPPARTRGGTA